MGAPSQLHRSRHRRSSGERGAIRRGAAPEDRAANEVCVSAPFLLRRIGISYLFCSSQVPTLEERSQRTESDQFGDDKFKKELRGTE